ncbi:hypothetical protein BC937DRAFT_93828 [Endogone sp. FLAS-F59071]|nr:hypothetical protein BC937DRAFT_93828 [Endogone sp. FLAS-F59071]|eukprot:RUS14436.1 hypothetical protein BC937DRAFT_93828 [Endogone sp. FLAS-F59071]
MQMDEMFDTDNKRWRDDKCTLLLNHAALRRPLTLGDPEPARVPITRTTSSDSSTCQLASVFLSGGPTVTAKNESSPNSDLRRARNMSSSVLSSPAHNTKSASGWAASRRFTISPLLIDVGRTSRFFFPTRISTGSFESTAFSR